MVKIDGLCEKIGLVCLKGAGAGGGRMNVVGK